MMCGFRRAPFLHWFSWYLWYISTFLMGWDRVYRVSKLIFTLGFMGLARYWQAQFGIFLFFILWWASPRMYNNHFFFKKKLLHSIFASLTISFSNKKKKPKIHTICQVHIFSSEVDEQSCIVTWKGISATHQFQSTFL